MQNAKIHSCNFWGSSRTRKRLVSTILPCMFHVTDFHYIPEIDGYACMCVGCKCLDATCAKDEYLCLKRACVCCWLFGSCLSKANFKHQPTNERGKIIFDPLTHVWLIYANYLYQSELQRNDSCFRGGHLEAGTSLLSIDFFFLFGCSVPAKCWLTSGYGYKRSLRFGSTGLAYLHEKRTGRIVVHNVR